MKGRQALAECRAELTVNGAAKDKRLCEIYVLSVELERLERDVDEVPATFWPAVHADLTECRQRLQGLMMEMDREIA